MWEQFHLDVLLAGATLGALISGLFKIIGEIFARRSARATLVDGFAAEIGAGSLEMQAPVSREQALFLASYGLPNEFHASNKDKIGLIDAGRARLIVSYYSRRWQFYNAGLALAKAPGIDEALAAERLMKSFHETQAAAEAALAGLNPSSFAHTDVRSSPKQRQPSSATALEAKPGE